MDVQLSDNVSSGFSAAAASIGLTLPQSAPAQSFAPVASAPVASAQPTGLPDFGDAAAAPTPPAGSTLKAGTLPAVDSHLGTLATAFLHAPRPLAVEFHTDAHPNEVVTILRDPTTGQIYAEFPPDAVARLADFFNHLAGFVVDHKA